MGVCKSVHMCICRRCSTISLDPCCGQCSRTTGSRGLCLGLLGPRMIPLCLLAVCQTSSLVMLDSATAALRYQFCPLFPWTKFLGAASNWQQWIVVLFPGCSSRISKKVPGLPVHIRLSTYLTDLKGVPGACPTQSRSQERPKHIRETRSLSWPRNDLEPCWGGQENLRVSTGTMDFAI